jgi:hypothetical protein
MSIPRPAQLDLFPMPREVVAVDPRTAIGPRTRVDRVFRVRYGGERRVHQILVDHHGWYCAEHGPGCGAVADARETVAAESAMASPAPDAPPAKRRGGRTRRAD